MSFINDYKIVTSGNEAPELYHSWAGIAVLSSVVSRQVWMNQGFGNVYPNLYLVLVGEPGNGKSTAMNIAKRMVRKIPRRPVAPSAITKEALCQFMGNEKGDAYNTFTYEGEEMVYSHLSVFANELVTFLGTDQMGMIDLLTDIWDEEVYENKTKNKGHDVIVGPFLTLLCCMTPEITDNLVRTNIIKGGFARRCIFICSNDRGKPVALPVFTQEQEEAYERCLEFMKILQNTKGEFSWTEESKTWFVDWYEKKYNKMLQQMSVATKGYYRSKDVLLIKVSMLLALAENPTDLTLHLRSLQEADRMLSQVERSLEDVFAGSGRNVEADIAKKVLALIKQQDGELSKKAIQGAMFDNATLDELNSALQYLVMTDKLKETMTPTDLGVVVTYTIK